MSGTYNRKMEVRDKRVDIRVALRIAKVVCKRFMTVRSDSVQRTLQTLIRQVVLNKRAHVLKQEDPVEQTDEWYNELLETLFSDKTEKHAYFRKTLGYDYSRAALMQTELLK